MGCTNNTLAFLLAKALFLPTMQIHECTRGCQVLLLDPGLPQRPLDTAERSSILERCFANCERF